MKLTLIRTDLLPDKTFGLIDIDGNYECFSLEDRDRKLESNPTEKVYGETCIPRGRYVVVLDFSARFKRTLPHVLGVAGFDGIRIHPGNTAHDTHGCILVGATRDDNGIAPGTSGIAFDRLMKKLTSAYALKEVIMLEVR